MLTWSATCFICNGHRATTFLINNTKLFVLEVTLSTQDDSKWFKQLRLGSKRTINWNKYQSKELMETQNQSLHFPVDPSFQGVKRLFCYHFRIMQSEQDTEIIFYQK